MEKVRILWVRLGFVLLFCVATVNLSVLTGSQKLKEAAANQGSTTLVAGTAQGTIYDRNGIPLVNQKVQCMAVINPTESAIAAVWDFVADKEAFLAQAEKGKPFVWELLSSDIVCEDVTVFKIPLRTGSTQLAQHLIGYTDENGNGVSGLEYAYDSILRSVDASWRVTYQVDGMGNARSGETIQVRYGRNPTDGILTTLDSTIQRICESAGSKLEKGCVVVMEVNTGEILALASFPSYDSGNLVDVLEDENSPLINRAFYAYPVGSIFKLVTAACALESNLGRSFVWDCTGSVSVSSQIFRCHLLSGHGIETMAEAMRNSCNPYFIALGQSLSAEALLETATALGFGTETMLTGNMIASSGTLPTLKQLALPAEQANFSFGQGQLTATPIQVTQMTCAIAGDGTLPTVTLVKGITEDGKTALRKEESLSESGISKETAEYLRTLMCYTASDPDFQGKPESVTMGAKTSTAQTGRYDANGEEYYDGWVTAFFPASDPQYAVTVLAEDGGYGNEVAAPILREIAEKIMVYKS